MSAWDLGAARFNFPAPAGTSTSASPEEKKKLQVVAIFPQKGSGLGSDGVRLQRKAFCLQQHSDMMASTLSPATYRELQICAEKDKSGQI